MGLKSLKSLSVISPRFPPHLYSGLREPQGLGVAKPAFRALSCVLPSLTLHEGVELVLLSSLGPLSSPLTPAVNSSVRSQVQRRP